MPIKRSLSLVPIADLGDNADGTGLIGGGNMSGSGPPWWSAVDETEANLNTADGYTNLSTGTFHRHQLGTVDFSRAMGNIGVEWHHNAISGNPVNVAGTGGRFWGGYLRLLYFTGGSWSNFASPAAKSDTLAVIDSDGAWHTNNLDSLNNPLLYTGPKTAGVQLAMSIQTNGSNSNHAVDRLRAIYCKLTWEEPNNIVSV